MLLRTWLILTLVLLWPGWLLQAQLNSKAKELLTKAIQAHGGMEALQKLSSANWKGRGLLYREGKEDKPLPFFGDWSAELPDKYRYTYAFKGIGGGRLPVTTGFSGDKAWRTMRPDRGADDLTEQQMKVEKEEAHAWQVSRLVPLMNTDYQLMSLPATQRDGRNIVGLKVDRKSYRSIYLFFDRQTHLLIYLDRKVFDPEKKQEVMLETSYLNFKPLGEAMLPQTIAMRQGKKLVLELDIDTVTPTATFPAQFFEKPPDPKE